MGQVTIYLDNETEERMRRLAEASGLSQSKWIAELIRRSVIDQWQESVKQLAGAWSDFPTKDELHANPAHDIPRERI